MTLPHLPAAPTVFPQRAMTCQACRRILITERDGAIPFHYSANHNPADKRWCGRSGEPAKWSEVR